VRCAIGVGGAAGAVAHGAAETKGQRREQSKEKFAKFSARIQIKGKIVEARKGRTTSLVQIDAGNGVLITWSNTDETIDELDLKAGDETTAVIKALDVMVARVTLTGREDRTHHIRRSGSFALALGWLAGIPSAWSADLGTVAISGRVTHPEHISVRDIRALPVTKIQSAFMTDRGPEKGVYLGALLWTVIASAEPIDEPGKNARLRHTFQISGRDGYSVALSDGEIDPHCEGKAVILAYEKDGMPLDRLRLIVPNDRRGGRAVKDVVAVVVR
jgi:molybdopterin-binding protein